MTEAPAIHQALAAVKKDIGAVGKSEKNQQQGWNFRGVDQVLNAVSGPLANHGVTVYPQLQDYTYETVEVGRNSTKMAHVVVKMKYIFVGPAGDSIESLVAAESMDSGDKAMTKAHSVALRTALIQTLSLPTDEPDPDHDVYERSSGSSQPAAKAVDKRTLTRPKAEPAKPAEAASAPAKATEQDLAKLAADIRAAKDAATLNKLYTRAGELGALTEELLDKETGETNTIQALLYLRNDQLKSTKSS